MAEKMSLEAAGQLLGITASAMRARARKAPERYRLERDNTGKIWVWLDPANLGGLKPSKPAGKRFSAKPLQPAMNLTIAALETALAAQTARAEAAERARDQAEGERDGWRQMAERLADRPARRWWPF